MSTPAKDPAPTKPRERASDRDDAAEVTLPVEVPLLHQRWRNGLQALFLVPIPIYLVYINSPDPGAGPSRPAAVPGIGYWVLCVACAIAAALGVRALVRLVRSFLRPAGTIAIRSERVELPPRLAGSPVSLVPGDLKHSYFIRRALSTTATGPILVIETSHGVFEYPRDWFESDADQRRVAAAVLRLTTRAK